MAPSRMRKGFGPVHSEGNSKPPFVFEAPRRSPTMLKWLEETIGGLEKMAAINQDKAQLLYGFMDSGDFYRATAEADNRSLMNVTFRLPNEDLEQQFVQQALANGLGGLKGHRSVGGIRASLYNAMPMSGVEALASYMESFR